MTETSAELYRVLLDCQTLLEEAGDTFWAGKVKRAAEELQSDKAHACSEILAGYGGMGSFNDVILTAVNGHSVSRMDEGKLNDRLSALRARIYSLAGQVKQES